MAIHIFCTSCKTSNGLDAKKCSKCGLSFGRDKKYRVCVSVKGQRVTRVVDNLTIARDAESAIKGDLVRGEYDISAHKAKKVTTLDDVWRQYLPWAKVNKRKSWVTDDFFFRKHLQPRFGAKAMENISAFDIERMKSEMKHAETPQGKKGYSDATVRHQLVLLGHIFKKAAEWRLYQGENPVKSVKKPKLDNKITEFLTDEEMSRLIDTLTAWPCKQSADFVKIAMYTGIRKSEIMKLKWEDIDLERKMVTLRDPKGTVTETVPISDEAVDIFRNIPASSEYVLPGPDGQIKKTFRDPWYKIRKAADLPQEYRLHGLRHNFASQLVSNGVDLYTVSKLLTHKDVRTSERYAHLSNEALRRAAQKSGELLKPKTKQTKIIQLVE
jgi:integrase